MQELVLKNKGEIKMKKRIIPIFLVIVMLLSISFVGCGKKEENNDTSSSSTTSTITKDLAGNDIVIPKSKDKIMSLASSCTDIIVSLGLSDNIVAIDKYSSEILGDKEDVMQFDLMKPDTEKIIAQDPDIVFVSSMSNAGGDDIFKPVRDAGICVVAIPSANSIDGIKESVQFIGDILDKSKEAEELVKNMENEISKISEIASTITEKKKVYFEIGSQPKLYTFGKDTFINEMIEIIGAENIFADQNEWITVSEESVIAANPDVILTNITYTEDPVNDILQRNGWNSIKAVKDNNVYFIDKNASSLSTHNIVVALKEMAKAVYPEYYGDI